MTDPRRTTLAFLILILGCIAAFSTWIANLPLEAVHLWAISMTISFVAAVLVTFLALKGKR